MRARLFENLVESGLMASGARRLGALPLSLAIHALLLTGAAVGPLLLYPAIARVARVQGVVVLECVIDEQGRVREIKVLRGLPLLDQAAIDAVRQWVYTPTLLNGVPVPVVMTVSVDFRLS